MNFLARALGTAALLTSACLTPPVPLNFTDGGPADVPEPTDAGASDLSTQTEDAAPDVATVDGSLEFDMGDGSRISAVYDDWVAISVGGRHACAVDVVGRVYCWGDNSAGQLGLPERTSFRQGWIESEYPFIAVAAGESHTCALNLKGGVVCWGQNSHGQIGLDADDGYYQPTLVNTPADSYDLIAAGGNHTCVATAAGDGQEVYCWGGNEFGAVDPAMPGLPTSNETVPAGGIVHLGLSEMVSCFVGREGSLTCRGSGPLTGCEANAPCVRDFADSVPFEAVSVGIEHACAITQGERRVWCWGSNTYRGEDHPLGEDHPNGKVGREFSTLLVPSPAPTDIEALLLDGTTAVVAGRNHGCAQTSAGSRCWGSNHFTQLGKAYDMQEDDRLHHRLVPWPTTLENLAAGDDFTCALTESCPTSPCEGGPSRRHAVCWGRNDHGQISVSGAPRIPVPTCVCPETAPP